MRVERLEGNPIITPELDPAIGNNINGPSLVRAPSWLERPLGRYYLYFAHHNGKSIRLAYADELAGPWKIHSPGTLQVAQSTCLDHIASPDVHVDEAERRIRMYFHGYVHHPQGTPDAHANAVDVPGEYVQRTKVATSVDGLAFEPRPEPLGPSYFRVFTLRGAFYAFAMPGILYRSPSGLTDFERGPQLFSDSMRHCALLLEGNALRVFHTHAGDCPESILCATIDLEPDWRAWKASEPETVLAPELDYEGAHLPREPSRRGAARGPVHQLRDPAIFREDGALFLVYSVAGESGLAIARLHPG